MEARQNARDGVDRLIAADTNPQRPKFIDCPAGRIPLNDCTITSADDVDVSGAIQKLAFPFGRYLPKQHQADVVVAGGGTAGAMAALGSLQEGARTVTVEYLPELGGTSSLGRVTGYYHGYKETRFFEFIEEGVKKQGRLTGRCARTVARMLHYRKQTSQSGGTLLTNAVTCGVTKDGSRVTGLVVERDGQLFVVPGKVVIDATGDGDVAAFAGADFDFGNQRMQCTQNYSQWDVNPGLKAWKDSSANRDYDILWHHKMSELQRGYELTHHHAHYYDFTPFLTVREARRITGDYTITLRDVILKRQYPDTICRASSDFDPHHFGDTSFSRIGCLLPHQVTEVVQIPYRAILPRGIDGLLISAKAISQTHNALQFTRMSFDIMTLGYVTGRIAANIVKQDIGTRDFDVACLRDELRESKILPAAEANANVTPHLEDSVAQAIDDLMAGRPNSLLTAILQPSKTIKPALLQAYGSAKHETHKLRIARALAWFGDASGNELILRDMKALFEQEQATGKLPWEYYRTDKSTNYWHINQDIALLGLSGDSSMLPDILALANSLRLGNPPVQQESAYNRGKIDLRLIPHYNRIITLCFAIERIPHAAAFDTLNRFLDDPFIANHVSTTREEAGVKMYGGILESRLAATLARCGSKRGLQLLADYLDDIHPMLTHYASRELASILEEDYGCDKQQWKDHLERSTFPLPPMPCRCAPIEV